MVLPALVIIPLQSRAPYCRLFHLLPVGDGRHMSIIKRAAAWLRMNPFRNYIVSIALALLPVSIFIFAAHKLLLNQITAKLITQSTQSGRVIGTVLVKHLDDGRIILESFST